MSLIIDIIVIAVFAISLLSGLKKGFIRSVMFTVVVVLAFIGAQKLSPDLAKFYNEKFIEKSVVNLVNDSIEDLLSDKVNIDTLMNDKEPAFLKVLDRFGVSHGDVEEHLNKSDDDMTENSKLKSISEFIGKPIAKGISKGAAFVTLFICLLIVLFVIAFVVSLVVKLPVLKAADKLLGGILGAISGILIAWGLSVAICSLMPHLSVVYDDVFSPSVIDNSVIVKFLGNFNPFNFIR